VERRQGSGTYARETEEASLGQVVLLVDAALKLGDDPFFSLLVERLQWAVQAAGARCVVERVTDGGGSRPRFLGDGALTVGLSAAAALSHLRAEDPPAVALLARPSGPLRPGARVSQLLADDHGAGAAAAGLLLSEGHRRLLFVGRRDLPAPGERAAGAAAAVIASGATLDTLECGLNYRAGHAAGSSLDAGRCDALIAANDWLAAGLRAGLAAQGGRPLPLVSFDGLPVARDPALGIRSFAMALEAMAGDAVAELTRFAGRGAPGRTALYALMPP
jgi:DNA-binding LacI/PurR family transcriptional regulator